MGKRAVPVYRCMYTVNGWSVAAAHHIVYSIQSGHVYHRMKSAVWNSLPTDIEFVFTLCTFQVRLCLSFIIHEIISNVKTLILH